MKIIIPVVDYLGPEKSVVNGLFDSEYACLYNTEDESYEWLKMRSISKKDGNLSVELKRRGITTVICRSLPLLALDLFKVSGFKLYKASAIGVAENIEFFNNGFLQPINERNALDEPCSAGACASCSSSC